MSTPLVPRGLWVLGVLDFTLPLERTSVRSTSHPVGNPDWSGRGTNGTSLPHGVVGTRNDREPRVLLSQTLQVDGRPGVPPRVEVGRILPQYLSTTPNPPTPHPTWESWTRPRFPVLKEEPLQTYGHRGTFCGCNVTTVVVQNFSYNTVRRTVVHCNTTVPRGQHLRYNSTLARVSDITRVLQRHSDSLPVTDLRL